MANKSVLELAVGTGQWDSGLKKAKQALDNFTSAQGGLQQALAKDNGDMAEFIKMMGNMDSTAKTTKQQLREISNVLTDFTAIYRNLTDEQKSSPFGQELAKGIDKLTERAGTIKDAMEDVALSIRNAASDTRMFDQIAGGMTAMTATFQTATGAAKLFGIQMGDDVKVIADLQAAMAVTSGLQQLQNLLQKQSVLMQGVNALQAEFNILAKANPYAILATAIAAVAGGYMLWSKNASKAEQAQKALNAELENTKNQLAQIDKDTDFSVGIAQAAGKSWKAIHDLRLEAARTKLQLADLAVDKLIDNGGSAEQMKEALDMQQKAWDNVMKVLNEGTIHDVQRRNGTGPFATKGHKTKPEDTNYAADSIMAQEKEVQKLTDAWNRASGAMRDGILKDLEAAKAKLEAMKNVVTSEIQEIVVTGSKLKSVTKNFEKGPVNFDSINTYISGIKDALKNADLGSEMYNSLTEKLRDATTMSSLLKELMERGLEGADLENVANALKEKLLSKDGIDQEAVQAWIDGLNEKIKEAGGVELSLNANTGEVGDKNEVKGTDPFKEFNDKATKFIGGLSSVSSGLKGLGLEIPKEVDNIIGVMQSVMQVIQGVHSIISAFEITAINANTAALIANTTALYVKGFLPGFANGGIVPHAANGFVVPGTHYSGDVTPIMANAGEVVLNHSQVNNLANELSSPRGGGIDSQPYVYGEQIYLGLQAYLMRSGMGEMVTSNNR